MLTRIGENESLLDVDEAAWWQALEHRGGCYCFRSPPCGACTEPLTEPELNAVGYTYVDVPHEDTSPQE